MGSGVLSRSVGFEWMDVVTFVICCGERKRLLDDPCYVFRCTDTLCDTEVDRWVAQGSYLYGGEYYMHFIQVLATIRFY